MLLVLIKWSSWHQLAAEQMSDVRYESRPQDEIMNIRHEEHMLRRPFENEQYMWRANETISTQPDHKQVDVVFIRGICGAGCFKRDDDRLVGRNHGDSISWTWWGAPWKRRIMSCWIESKERDSEEPATVTSYLFYPFRGPATRQRAGREPCSEICRASFTDREGNFAEVYLSYKYYH